VITKVGITFGPLETKIWVFGRSRAVNADPNGIASITTARTIAVKYFILNLLKWIANKSADYNFETSRSLESPISFCGFSYSLIEYFESLANASAFLVLVHKILYYFGIGIDFG